MKIQDYWNYEENDDDYSQGVIPIAKKGQKKTSSGKPKHKKDSRQIARENKLKRQEEGQ